MLTTPSDSFSALLTTSKQFRGFAHCHSTHSYDGSCSYAKLREFFLAKHLDFVCITEHIETLNQEKVNLIIADCRANSDEQFLFIPGIEMDEYVVYFIGLNHVDIDFSSSKSVFTSLLSASKLCAFSHPIKAKYHYPDWLIQHCDAVEVWNTKHDGIYFPRKQSINLLDTVRKVRPFAVPLVGMDFHNPSHLSPANIKLQNSGPLTEEFILAEIKQGRFSICKDDQELEAVSSIKKNYFWFRIQLMDTAHALHLRLSSQGIVIPKPVKRLFRRLMEGK